MNDIYERPENIEEWDPPFELTPKLNLSEEERQKKIQEVLERARLIGEAIRREQQ